MSQLNYPDRNDYALPKKNILVLSCIDLRLTDNLVDFLNFDNLQNRYDHFALAGTSLSWSAPKKTTKSKDGVTVQAKELSYHFLYEVLEKFKHFEGWKDSLEHHIDIAVDLHHIKDVYIVEHENCGAYDKFLSNPGLSSYNAEKQCHADFAENLAKYIISKSYNDAETGKAYHLKVHSFFIDLRGSVELLHSF